MNRLTRLVAEREIRETLRKKAIWISMGLLLLASLALVILPEVLPDNEFERDLVTVGDVPAEVTEAFDAGAESIDLTLNTDTAADAATASQLVKDGDANLALVWDDPPRILQRTDDPDATVSLIQRVLHDHRAASIFAEAGVDDDVLAEVAAIEPAPVEVVDTGRDGRQTAAFGLILTMYLAIMMLASAVASSVATEKANRVAEVLLAVVPARSLMYGKVIGVGFVGFATLAVAAIPLLAKTAAGGNVPESLGSTLLSSGAWLAGGIVVYLLLAAMLGALADRTEDVGSAVAPLTVGLVAIYLASIPTTETSIGVVLSIVPLSSPISMPARLAIGVAEPWQIIASLVAMALAIVLVARLAVTIYGRAIVRTGRRLKLIEVIRTSSG